MCGRGARSLGRETSTLSLRCAVPLGTNWLSGSELAKSTSKLENPKASCPLSSHFVAQACPKLITRLLPHTGIADVTHSRAPSRFSRSSNFYLNQKCSDIMSQFLNSVLGGYPRPSPQGSSIPSPKVRCWTGDWSHITIPRRKRHPKLFLPVDTQLTWHPLKTSCSEVFCVPKSRRGSHLSSPQKWRQQCINHPPHPQKGAQVLSQPEAMTF